MQWPQKEGVEREGGEMTKNWEADGRLCSLETTSTSQVFRTPRWEDTVENTIRWLFEKIR